jgi:cyanophycin synthetase
MGYRTCNVGAVLNVTEDHLGTKGVDTLEHLAEVKRIVVEVARDCAVLNADDHYCLRMADHTKAARIAYVTMNARHELVRKHLRAGGLAVVLEEGINGHMITLYDKGAHLPLLWTHLIPATIEGKAMHNVQNAMFAAVMAYAMGVKVENIRQGLRTFDTTYFQVPGRTNVFDKLPFKVILDYGHNPAAIQAMADLVNRLECSGRRICVLSAPGDRRDADIRAIAQIASKAFDVVVLRRDDDTRGRGSDEVPRMMEAELLASGFPKDRIHMVPDEQTAIETGLKLCKRGDLLLAFADKVSRSWKQIIYFKPEGDDVKSTPPPAPSGTLRAEAPRSAAAPLLPSTDDVSLAFATLIEDERGVRLAREQED